MVAQGRSRLHFGRSRSGGRPRRYARRSYVLLLVIAFVAMVTLLGLSFSQKTVTSVPQADNRVAALQAQSLAASGVAIAAQFLIYPPTGSSACSPWTGTGAGGISIDGSSNYVTVSVARSATAPRLHTITCVGTVLNSAGAVRAKRTVVADIVLPPPHQWCLPEAYLSNVSQILSAPARFTGDVVTNESISNSTAWTKSHVYAGTTIQWGSGTSCGPPAGLHPDFGRRLMPTIVPSDYGIYTIDGQQTCYASPYLLANLVKNAWPCNGGAVTALNPGGVVFGLYSSTGRRSLTIPTGVFFTGTIVVDGDLIIDGSSIVLTAVSGFPAIVVTGDLITSANTDNVTVNGAVLVGGEVWKGGKRSTLTVNGPLVNHGKIGALHSSAKFNVNGDVARGTLYNFNGMKDTQPYSVLRWVEQ